MDNAQHLRTKNNPISELYFQFQISVLPPVAFPESEELSRRNAIRKKSIIGTQLSRLRRLSFQRSLSTPVNNVSFNEFSKN